MRSKTLSFSLIGLVLFCSAIFCKAAAPTTAPSTAPPQQSFTIIPSRSMAPCTLHVNALPITLSHGTPLTAKYEWDFGDETSDSHYNKLVGWNAAHIFTKPGRYTIALTLTDDAGNKRTFKKDLSIVGDIRHAIYVSTSGSDSNTGSDPNHPIRSLSKISRQLHDDMKVLLREGDTFDVSDKITIKFNNVLIDSYVDPTRKIAATKPVEGRPVVRFTGPLKYVPVFVTEEGDTDFTMQNLAFDSVYSHNTEKTGMPDILKPAGYNTTVRNCVFLNVGYGINCNAQPHGVLAQDNSCPLETGLRSYFAWVQGSDHVYLGNTVANSTREHCLRVGGADRILLAYNTFSNLDRRPADKGNDKTDTSKGAMTIHAGSYVYITHNTLPHGELLIGPLGQQDGLKNIAARWNWAVVEDNVIDSWIYINHGTNHVLCRGNTINRSDWACFIVEGFNAQYNRGNSDITIVNNNGTNKAARGNFLRVTGPVEGITLSDNRYTAPKLKPGDDINSSPVFVDDKDLSSFRAIIGNTWPDMQGGKGVNYVKGMGGYLTEKQWLACPVVKGDKFGNAAPKTAETATQPAESAN